MRRFRVILFFIVITVLSHPAWAQITLEECQELARYNYPLLKKYDLIKQTSGYNIRNINKGYMPQLSFSGDISYQSEVADLPEALSNMLASNGYDYKGMEKDQYKIALNMNQVIWDGGNIKAQKELARAEEKIQTAQTDVEMYAIRSRVNELFFGILLLDEKIKLNEELQNLLQDNCRKLEAQRKSGTAMKSDVDAVQAEFLQARQDMTALKSMRKRYQQMLAIFTGKDTDDISILQKPAAILPDTYESQRPELNLYSLRMQHAEVQKKLLNAGIRPKLSLFAQGFYGYPGYDLFNSMFYHNMKLYGIVGVKLTWDISKFYTLRADRNKLDIAQKRIETERETFIFKSRLQSAQETEAIEQYRKMMEDDTDIIKLRTSVRRAAEAKLEHGIIDVNNLLQEITKENKARIEHSSHELEMLKNIYELRNTINR